VGDTKNFELVEQLYRALREREDTRYGDFYAENATVRMAGVPRSLGGVLEGRDRIVENLRRHDIESYDVRLIFGDGDNVCAVIKLSGAMVGTQFLEGNNQPYTTYECVVYQIAGGRILEQTSYINWMDVYVQAGMVALAPLRA
jgi:ketosteroid isomerase-like protein